MTLLDVAAAPDPDVSAVPAGGMAPMSRTADPVRRLHPKIFDADWLVLRGLARAIEGLLAPLPLDGLKVLDFGCGTRPYAPLFEGRGACYAGADLDGSEVGISADGRLNAGDGGFDAVASFQVLEHVRRVDVYLAEARRMLRDGGWMLLSTHGSWLYHAHPEDHRRWTREGLVAEIEAAGFSVEACVPVVGPLAWTTVLRLTCACYALRRVPAIGPALCGGLSLLVNLRAWLEDAITPDWVTRDNACVYVVLARRS